MPPEASRTFASIDEIPAGFWRWAHIDAATEWACPHCGSLIVVPEFLDRLEELRHRCGFPLHFSSGYRCPVHNRAVSTTGDTGPHTTGLASDIRAYGTQARAILNHAAALQFRGIGLRQHGAVLRRFLHLDDLGGDAHEPRPWIWTYNAEAA
jgi:hypothetical protein